MLAEAKPQGVRWEGVLAGEGGQGLVVAGIILGEAAVLEGLHAVQCQWVFGSAARGSLSRSEVVVGPEEIAFPRVLKAGVLLALTPAALTRHLGMLGPGALVIVDSDHVPDTGLVPPDADVRPLPILRTAAGLELARSTNVFALGALVALTGVVRPENIEEALRRRFGVKAEPNLRAFRAGADLAAGG